MKMRQKTAKLDSKTGMNKTQKSYPTPILNFDLMNVRFCLRDINFAACIILIFSSFDNLSHNTQIVFNN